MTERDRKWGLFFYTALFLIAIFVFMAIKAIGHSIKERIDNQYEEFFPQKSQKKNSGITSAIITPDIIFVGSFYF